MTFYFVILSTSEGSGAQRAKLPGRPGDYTRDPSGLKALEDDLKT